MQPEGLTCVSVSAYVHNHTTSTLPNWSCGHSIEVRVEFIQVILKESAKQIDEKT